MVVACGQRLEREAMDTLSRDGLLQPYIRERVRARKLVEPVHRRGIQHQNRPLRVRRVDPAAVIGVRALAIPIDLS
jgi:hypothetical protein